MDFSVFKAEETLFFPLKRKLILLNRTRYDQVKFRQMLSRSEAEASRLIHSPALSLPSFSLWTPEKLLTQAGPASKTDSYRGR